MSVEGTVNTPIFLYLGSHTSKPLETLAPGKPLVSQPTAVQTSGSGLAAHGLKVTQGLAGSHWARPKEHRSFFQERRKLRDMGLQDQPQQDCGCSCRGKGGGHTAHQSLLTKPRHIHVSGSPHNPPVRGVQHRRNPPSTGCTFKARVSCRQDPVLEATGSLWVTWMQERFLPVNFQMATSYLFKEVPPRYVGGQSDVWVYCPAWGDLGGSSIDDPPERWILTMSQVGEKREGTSSQPFPTAWRPGVTPSLGLRQGQLPGDPAAQGISSRLFFLLFSPRWERAAPGTLAEVGQALTGRAGETHLSRHVGE